MRIQRTDSQDELKHVTAHSELSHVHTARGQVRAISSKVMQNPVKVECIRSGMGEGWLE